MFLLVWLESILKIEAMLVVVLLGFLASVQGFAPRVSTRVLSYARVQMNSMHDMPVQLQSFFLAAEEQVAAVTEAVSPYSKIDKTGPIGFLGGVIEQAIDGIHNLLHSAGIEYTYGFAIIFFTLCVRALTLPLTVTQLESTNKMQKLTPLQRIIQEKYANDEATKNQLLSQLFQASNVNPLAGCFPALAQIPIFLSLYRALQNLIAENKLGEPFLWIPDLEGPVYMKPPGQSLDWVKSIVTGSPELGWEKTLAYLSIPLILYISQSVSMKILQPPKDPNRVYTEQEQVTQGILNQLPFILAFFSLNVPAGLGLYWIVSNVLTTVITVAVRSTFKDDSMPVEVERMMAAIAADGASSKGRASSMPSSKEMFNTVSVMESRPKSEGFGKVVDVASEDVTVTAVGESAEGDSAVQEAVAETGEDTDGKKKKRKGGKRR